MLAAFSFNQFQAQTQFKRALLADSACVLCAWGIAYAQSPYLNRVVEGAQGALPYPVFSCADRRDAFESIKAAQALSAKVEEESGRGLHRVHEAMVHTLWIRFSGVDPLQKGGDDASDDADCDIAALRAGEARHAVAWEQALQHPDFWLDPTALALAAEAAMNTSPWRYTRDEASGELVPAMRRVLMLIDAALHLDPSHLLALHLKVHMLEAQPRGRGAPGSLLSEAEAAADGLAALARSPGMTGHLLHMPAHVYIGVARWSDAVAASEASVKRDLEDSWHCAAPYLPEHDLDMLLFAASMLEGGRPTAERAARTLAAAQDHFLGPYMWQVPDTAIPTELALRYGLCKQARAAALNVVAGRDVDERAGHSAAALRPLYGAAVRTFVDLSCLAKELASARKKSGPAGPESAHWTLVNDQLSELQRIADKLTEVSSEWGLDDTKPGYGIGIYSPGMHVRVSIYVRLAHAQIAMLHNSDSGAAVTALQQAVTLEHSMGYTEPPRVFAPVRPCLTVALLRSGRFEEAVAAAEADLNEFPGNVWGKKALQHAKLAKSAHAAGTTEKVSGDVNAAVAACPMLFAM